MVRGRLRAAVEYLYRTAGPPDSGDSTDAQLLLRFVGQRDEAAFAAVVRRHGPLVLGVCRRILGDAHEAEDAFQATFLVLARKAGSIGKRGSLRSWLYGVARRTAVRARAGVRRRRALEGEATEASVPDATGAAAWRDLRPVLDEEVNRLPDRYRSAVLLCYLEGKTLAEAAEDLGCPRGTVAARLARARNRLRRRLTARGLALSAGLMSAAALPEITRAAVRTELVDSTSCAAALFAAGRPTTGQSIPGQVAVLAEGVMRTMSTTKLRAVCGLMLAAAAACLGIGVLAYQARATGEKDTPPEPAAPQQVEDRPKGPLRLTLEGPVRPVLLDRELNGPLPLRLWLENVSGEPLVVCLPVDGSMYLERDPRYVFRLTSRGGRALVPKDPQDCEWHNPLNKGDFITLKPGQMREVLGRVGAFGQLYASMYENLAPGEYRLTATYLLKGGCKLANIPPGPTGARTAALYGQAWRGEATSNAVTIRFARPPGTARLLDVLRGKGDGQVTAAEAVLVLGGRRDGRGLEPTLRSLADGPVEVRRAAAFALRHYAAAYSVGQLKDPTIIPDRLFEALRRATDDPDREVRQTAAISLRFAREYLAAVKSKKGR
jgi:RNA polymerase sigma factor (sigma-70 family)